MVTHSNIIVERSDGTWARIYCHWDGYLESNGRILAEHYTTQDKVECLVSHGDMSFLAPECTKPKGHSFDTPKAGYCVYYGRDRSEASAGTVIGKSLCEVWPSADTWGYIYVWRIGKGWFVIREMLVPLALALTAQNSSKANVTDPIVEGTGFFPPL